MTTALIILAIVLGTVGMTALAAMHCTPERLDRFISPFHPFRSIPLNSNEVASRYAVICLTKFLQWGTVGGQLLDNKRPSLL